MSEIDAIVIECDGCKVSMSLPIVYRSLGRAWHRSVIREALAKNGWRSRTRLGKRYDACPDCLTRLNDPDFGRRPELPAASLPAVALAEGGAS